VLEELAGKSFGNLNTELSKFMKKEIYAAAYLNEGLKAEAADEKMQAFLRALELKPDYRAVQIELALCYRAKKDYEKYRQYLEPILSDSLSAQFRPAAEFMGNMYYKNKDYQKALEYYLKSWEYCGLYEYKYKTAYKIANCYYYLKDRQKSTRWYWVFLENNFEPEQTQAQVAYAKKYLE
jgi:tetratricopeptide (TPR) repeat protein